MLLRSQNSSLSLIMLVTLLAHGGVLLIKGAQTIINDADRVAPIQLTTFTMSNAPFVPGVPIEKPAVVKPKPSAVVSSTSTVKDTVTTQEAAVDPAPAAGSGGVASSVSAAGTMASGDLRAIYLSELRARLEEVKHYPLQARRLGQTGSVEVAFRVQADGLIEEARIVRPSPFQRLNDSALATVASLKRFRPLPAGMTDGDSLLVTLPIRYTIRN